MKIGEKPTTLVGWVELVLTIWGFASLVLLLAASLGWIPFYVIEIRNKFDITPQVALFPGQQVQLHPDFNEPVNTPDIEDISWTLKKPTGDLYQQSKLKDFPVLLHPDYAGAINVSVEAKIKGDNAVRRGSTNLHVVQVDPIPSIISENAMISAPGYSLASNIETLQFYKGDGEWVSATMGYNSRLSPGVIAARDVPNWNGKVYARYEKLGVGPSDGVEFGMWNVLPKVDVEWIQTARKFLDDDKEIDHQRPKPADGS